MTEHKHIWKKAAKIHNRPPRFFVECACGAARQAVIRNGFLHVFHTGANRGGTNVVTLRLSNEQHAAWKRSGETARAVFERGMRHGKIAAGEK